MGNFKDFDNLENCEVYSNNNPPEPLPPKEVKKYKDFTKRKLEYLKDKLPEHFKLNTLLREYCESQNEPQYNWFLSLNIL